MILFHVLLIYFSKCMPWFKFPLAVHTYQGIFIVACPLRMRLAVPSCDHPRPAWPCRCRITINLDVHTRHNTEGMIEHPGFHLGDTITRSLLNQSDANSIQSRKLCLWSASVNGLPGKPGAVSMSLLYTFPVTVVISISMTVCPRRFNERSGANWSPITFLTKNR